MRTTVTPGSVVVGVDGSPFSDAAVEWAAAHAAARRTPLTLVHAVGDLGGYLVPLRAEARHMAAPVARRIIEQARGIARRTSSEVDLETRTLDEDPRQALLGVEDAYMLVVGTRGHGPIASLLLGSVSQALVSHATCPVTVVRPADERPVDGDEGKRGKVVVGVDVDGAAGEALEVAFEIASMSRRPVEVLHAAAAPDRELAELAELLAGYSEKYPDVQVTTRMADDAPAEALVHASETAAHVVVGGPDGRRGLRHLGSVGRTVVEHSHCPVTVIPPPRGGQRGRR
jgi:nucleotide-binding universal stress UspA family protein